MSKHLDRVALSICSSDCQYPCAICRDVASRAGLAYAAILQEAYGGSSLTAERIVAIAVSPPTANGCMKKSLL